MDRSTILTRLRRLGPALAIFLMGDRALLRLGGPGLIARVLRLRQSIYRPHPYTLYELNPDWRSANGRARHNRLGFRGAEITVEKPHGRIRIVCMGESTTYCTGIDDDSATYPARLEAHLRACKPDLDIEVINAGVGGYTSIENVLRCQFHIAPLSPDVIIFYYTHNDVHPRRMPRLSRDYREYSRSWYEPHFRGGLRGAIARRYALATGDIGNLVRRYNEYTGRRPTTNITNNPANAFRANMLALALITRAAGARLMVVNPPYRDLHKFLADRPGKGNLAYRAVFEHRRIIEDLGATLGFSVYDLAGHMPYPDDPKAFPSEHYLDSTHVNEKGADLMGRLIAGAAIAEDLLSASVAPLGKVW